MIDLGEKAWERLFGEVLLIATRMTRTRDALQEATQIDRAREATQQAFERYLRVRPANLDTIEAVRKYLVWTVRSVLSNAKEEQGARRRHESAASTEQATVDGVVARSAEVIHIEVAAANRRRECAALALKRLYEALSDDRVALGTIDCIEKGKTEPAEQARILECSVEEIYAARKRRKRALDKILAEDTIEEDQEKA